MFLVFLYLLLHLCSYYLVQASSVRKDTCHLLFVLWKQKEWQACYPVYPSQDWKEISTTGTTADSKMVLKILALSDLF